MNRYIYLCEDCAEGIFSAVYRAYEDGHGHENNEIRLVGTPYNQEFFCEYIKVATDFEKAEKVGRTIRQKISGQAYACVMRAAVSWDAKKADAIYRFVIEGLRRGGRVISHLSSPAVQTFAAIDRNVSNEICRFREILRFEELENGILFGKINPQSAILPFLSGHFSDRFPEENWIIADTGHRTVLLHRRGEKPVYAELPGMDFDELILSRSGEEERMQRLWKMFVDTIAIKERINPDLQRQLLPFKYRRYMTEFTE